MQHAFSAAVCCTSLCLSVVICVKSCGRYWLEEIVVISGSILSGRKWITRQRFDATVSLSSTSNWLRLPIAAKLLNGGFSTGFISTSGRAISGSGLDASPDLSACISADTTILDGIIRLSRDCKRRTILLDS